MSGAIGDNAPEFSLYRRGTTKGRKRDNLLNLEVCYDGYCCVVAASPMAACRELGYHRSARDDRIEHPANRPSLRFFVSLPPSFLPPPTRLVAVSTARKKQVQAVAARAPNAPKMAALGAAALSDSPPEDAPINRAIKPGRERKSSPRGTNSTTTTTATSGTNNTGAAAGGSLPAGSFPETPPTTLFFMRSHAQPIVLACHRTRWLVLSWASAGPASAEALQRATDPKSLAGSVRAAEAAVRRLSLAVDHLSYLRTARPLLAGCVAYWLWEHGGVRAHVGKLASAGEDARGDGGGGDGGSSGAESGVAAAVVEEGRPAREAFLTAAEEFLKVEALFSRRGDRGGGGGGRPGGGGEKSEVSFASLLTEGAVQRCPWPGAWDRWVEECLRDAQVSGLISVFGFLRSLTYIQVPGFTPLKMHNRARMWRCG